MFDKTKRFKDYMQAESGFLYDSSGIGIYSSATARWWINPHITKHFVRFRLTGTINPAIILIDGI